MFYDNNFILKMIKISAGVLLASFIFMLVAIIRYEPPRKYSHISARGEVTITEVEKKLSSIGEIATYQYEYVGEAELEDDRDWVILNFLTDSEIEIEYEGVIKAGIRIEDIIIDVDNDRQLIIITLPKPVILSNEIVMTDYSEDVDVFGKVDGDDAAALLEESRSNELQMALDDGILVMATENARQVIANLLSVYDDYQVTFVYADPAIREEMR